MPEEHLMARSGFGIIDTALALALVGAAPCAMAAEIYPQLVTPAAMRPLATIDERLLSYNVEMAEVIGGTLPAGAPPGTPSRNAPQCERIGACDRERSAPMAPR
jgi:hypothetical protein